MPCSDNYPRSSQTDERTGRLARLICEFGAMAGYEPSRLAVQIMGMYYKADTAQHLGTLTAELCGKMRGLRSEQLADLQSRGYMGKEVVRWWEDHKLQDAGRAAWEEHETQRIAIARAAILNLPPDQQLALKHGTEPRPFVYMP